jgi:hypothetical protein
METCPGGLIDFRFQSGPLRFVRIVLTEEVGVAYEEALLVVIGIEELAGDTLRPIAAHFAGVGMEDIDA